MKFRKLIAFVCAVSLFGSGAFGVFNTNIPQISAVSYGEEYTSGDFVYSFFYEKTIIITQYTGNDTDVVFPSEIDGYEVVALSHLVFSFNDNSKNIKSVTVSSGIQYIGDTRMSSEGVFYFMSSLESVKFEGDIIFLGDGTFGGCISLKEVIMDNVTSDLDIPEKCFASCRSLETISLPESTVSLGEYAFNGCTKLSEIVIPGRVKTIGSYCFQNTKLSEITIPGSVIKILNAAFNRCPDLKRVTMEEGVKQLSAAAFGFNPELSEINIPSTLTVIWENAFTDTPWQNDMLEKTHYIIVNGLLVTSDISGDIVIPEGVTEINGYSFIRNEGITSVVIPEGVTVIGNSAFAQCPNLKSVKCPESLISIGSSAFSKDYVLESVDIPSAQSIDVAAFDNCNALKEIKFPDNLVKVSKNAILRCENLEKVIVPEGVKELGETFINDCKNVDVYIYCKQPYMNLNALEAECVKTIYGYAGSTAERYATKKNIPFKLIGEEEAADLKDTVTGDSDGNGVVNMEDIVCLVKYLVADSDSINAGNADINKDGVVNVLDLIAIKQLFLK